MGQGNGSYSENAPSGGLYEVGGKTPVKAFEGGDEVSCVGGKSHLGRGDPMRVAANFSFAGESNFGATISPELNGALGVGANQPSSVWVVDDGIERIGSVNAQPVSNCWEAKANRCSSLRL